MSESIEIAVVYDAGIASESDWMFRESHNCHDDPRCAHPCRACAQARVEHDPGDEQPGAWPESHGRWLVGGGRYSAGIMGPRPWGDWDPPDA